MADQPISTPPTSTGILRFYDVDSSRVELDPKIVVGFALALIILEIALQAIH